MVSPHAMPGTIPSSSSLFSLIFRDKSTNKKLSPLHKSSPREWVSSSRGGIGSISRVLNLQNPFKALYHWRLNAIGVDSHTNSRIVQDNAPAVPPTLEIPVSCYQLTGIPDRSEKDEIVKSVMDLKSAEIEEGYTLDAVISRQDLLMDVRDKLLFEPEYAGNVKEKIPPKYSIQIPWAWLPGALCLLQEVGEVKLVLGIGQAAVQHPGSKPYVHDLVLSMALAECVIAKVNFEKNKVSQGFEALARAQCLLRSKTSLGKLTLLSQIEESLEELAPACTLELLGMPCSPENSERRQGAIAALSILLRQGLDVQISCQVQDWTWFLSQALRRLMAKEIIDLLSWSDLADVRKNKKSLESQNQRVIIDFNCFYIALMAHIALGFSSKRTELITEAKTICQCLTASECIDLKLEEAFCSFLLGQGNEADVVDKLQQLELKSNPTANAISGKENKGGENQTLETWLKEVVLGSFPDTRDCPASLDNFFRSEKRTESKKIKGSPETLPVGQRPMSNTFMSDRIDFDGSLSHLTSSQHLGTVIKQLTPTDLKSSHILGKDSAARDASAPSVQLKRNLVLHRNKFWEGRLAQGNQVIKISFVVVVGCIVFATLKLISMKVTEMSASERILHKGNTNTSSLGWTRNSDYCVVPAYIKGDGIAGRLKKLLVTFMRQSENLSDVRNLQTSCPAASMPSSMTSGYRRLMSTEEAEALVKEWQAIKAEALGPVHLVHSLPEILDETMLIQWQTLADAAKAKSCYWKFVLLQLSVERAEIISDGIGIEMVEIDAVLEEAAELVNEYEKKNPSYYSTYKVHYVLRRQDNGSWRFCEGDIFMPS